MKKLTKRRIMLILAVASILASIDMMMHGGILSAICALGAGALLIVWAMMEG